MTRILKPVHTVFADIQPVLARYLSATRTEQLAAYLKERHDASRPVIMVYGVYNAGKSTLINALLGEERAAMGRVPTTDVVQAYDWAGYELLDTPGVDAPAEHEAITEAQLAISDLVIFVVDSSGVSDELATYESILTLVARDKRVMVVVNNTEGLRLGDTQQVAFTSEVQARLQDVAARRDMPTAQLLDRVPVRWVNAQSALKARLQDKPVLLRESGLPALADDLKGFIADTDKADLTNSLAGALSQAIGEAMEALQAEQASTDTDSHRRFQQRLESEEQRLHRALLDRVLQQRHRLMSEFRRLMEEAGDGMTQAYLEQQLVELTRQLTEELQDNIRTELTRTGERLQAMVDTLEPASGQLTPAVSLNEPVGELTSGPAVSEPREGLSLPVGSLQKLVGSIRSEHLVRGMELGKQWLPTLFKGIGPKTMEKIADKTLHYLKLGGPIVQVGVQLVSGIYQYYRAEQEIQEGIARQQRHQQQVRDAAERLGFEYAQSARAGVEACIAQALQPAHDQLDAMFAQATGASQQLERDRRHLVQARSTLALE